MIVNLILEYKMEQKAGDKVVTWAGGVENPCILGAVIFCLTARGISQVK